MWEKAPCRTALLKDIFRSVHKNLEILTEHLKLYQRFFAPTGDENRDFFRWWEVWCCYIQAANSAIGLLFRYLILCQDFETFRSITISIIISAGGGRHYLWELPKNVKQSTHNNAGSNQKILPLLWLQLKWRNHLTFHSMDLMNKANGTSFVFLLYMKIFFK